MNINKFALFSLVGGISASIVAGDGTTATNGGDSATAANGDSMTTCAGQDLTLTEQDLQDSRDFLYCELVFNYAGGCGGDIYSTSPLAPCDLDWWNNLDLDALAQEFGAESVDKNGPQYWSMDEVTVEGSEPLDVGGANMIFGANLPPGTMGNPSYTVFYPTKTQYLVWKAGLPTYQLTDADGYNYVLQGYKVDKDDLANLGDQFQDLPDGWSYNVVTLDEDLVFNLTPDAPIPSVQDEFDQIYIRVPEDDVDDPTSGGHMGVLHTFALLLAPILLHFVV